ncbi:metal-dependent hydrolase family protein [Flavobacterium nackdongense]|uniref:Amidohydrolase family protein n=1 Tax=Flavobacterium nackdongense TaxID=2547394 RepID=A0A4P6Y628_9FLAO|nr:amidohydrolase family protein [Flavobacterium nackdongense]QBN17726.1 amidohydrolase family protein [Flavobacterium nackdongense]
MKHFITSALFFLAVLVQAQSKILINNVQIFNGKDNKTVSGNVLIENNLITKISSSPIMTDKSGNTKIIDGKGKFLMPGLIDIHMHEMLSASTLSQMQNGEVGAAFIRAGVEAGNILQRGFTSIRDLGGPIFGVKKTIDDGAISGPRIWPSGPMISQTAGHGDFRGINQRPVGLGGSLDHSEIIDACLIADGKDAVLVAVRETLKRGASQIKLCAGGGISSSFDPLDVSQFTEEEIRAAVEAAEDWGTYVTVHAFTSRAVNKAIAAGVKCIEHGQLLDDATMKLMADKGIWLSIQALDEEGRADFSEEQKRQKAEVANGADAVIKMAKKYKVKMAWGTDVFFNPAINKDQNTYIAKMSNWFTPFEVLKLITSDNAQLLTLSGNRSPYKEGKLGVIEEGAYADMILVDGNPLQDINIMVDYDKNFLLIVKDGAIYKNTLNQ